jgi:hypothetical protein
VRLGSSDAHMWDHALVDPHVGPCTDGAHMWDHALVGPCDGGTTRWWGHAMVLPYVGPGPTITRGCIWDKILVFFFQIVL